MAKREPLTQEEFLKRCTPEQRENYMRALLIQADEEDEYFVVGGVLGMHHDRFGWDASITYRWKTEDGKTGFLEESPEEMEEDE